MTPQNKYQQERLDNALALCKEVNALGYNAFVKEINNNEYEPNCIISTSAYTTRDYEIKRGWRGDILLDKTPYKRYEYVSTHTQSEVRKNISISNKVKVLTAKKLQTLIDEDNAYHDKLDELELIAEEKINDFLDSVSELKGFEIHYSYADFATKEKITGGYILKNGLEFSFGINQDGYISKKIQVHYSLDCGLNDFVALSDNKFIQK